MLKRGLCRAIKPHKTGSHRVIWRLKNHRIAAPRSPEWETAFLDLIHTICSMQDSPGVRLPHMTLHCIASRVGVGLIASAHQQLSLLIEPRGNPRSPEWEIAFLDLICTICSMQDSPRCNALTPSWCQTCVTHA